MTPIQHHPSVQTLPTVVDLFAGAGLFSLAFKMEGFSLAAAYEQEAQAVRTYRENLGDHVVHGDLSSIRPSGRCDVLVAGPPCQGFSSLGSRRQNDPRNRLALLVPVWSLALQPQVVVVENVDRFQKSSVWEELVRKLADQGFDIDTWSLDAAHYGVPQRRRRSFTIASRGGLTVPRRVTVTKLKTVREAWAGLTAEPDGKNQHVAVVPSKLALARMRVVPPGGDKRDILQCAPHLAPPSWERVGCHATDVWGRMRWDRPANTIRTCLVNPSKGRYIHPDQNRTMSLREAARLQSVPDSHRFLGTPYQVARQIGNGVPVKLGRAIARSVRRHLS